MLYSVWNETTQRWATSTNFSTYAEAEALLKTIRRQLRNSDYVVKQRPLGTPYRVHSW